MSLDVDFLAVLGATAAVFVLGALWYGLIFGRQWRMLMGHADGAAHTARLSMAQAAGGSFLASLLMVFILASFLPATGALSAGIALNRAFLIWLGFVATALMSSALRENRPLKLYAINASYYLVSLLLAAFLLVWWPW